MKIEIGKIYGCGSSKIKIFHIEKNTCKGGVLFENSYAVGIIVDGEGRSYGNYGAGMWNMKTGVPADGNSLKLSGYLVVDSSPEAYAIANKKMADYCKLQSVTQI